MCVTQKLQLLHRYQPVLTNFYHRMMSPRLGDLVGSIGNHDSGVVRGSIAYDSCGARFCLYSGRKKSSCYIVYEGCYGEKFR